MPLFGHHRKKGRSCLSPVPLGGSPSQPLRSSTDRQPCRAAVIRCARAGSNRPACAGKSERHTPTLPLCLLQKARNRCVGTGRPWDTAPQTSAGLSAPLCGVTPSPRKGSLVGTRRDRPVASTGRALTSASTPQPSRSERGLKTPTSVTARRAGPRVAHLRSPRPPTLRPPQVSPLKGRGHARLTSARPAPPPVLGYC